MESGQPARFPAATQLCAALLFDKNGFVGFVCFVRKKSMFPADVVLEDSWWVAANDLMLAAES